VTFYRRLYSVILAEFSLKLNIMHSSRNVEQKGALPQPPMSVLAHHSSLPSWYRPCIFWWHCWLSTKSFHRRTVIDLAARLGPHKPPRILAVESVIFGPDYAKSIDDIINLVAIWTANKRSQEARKVYSNSGRHLHCMTRWVNNETSLQNGRLLACPYLDVYI